MTTRFEATNLDSRVFEDANPAFVSVTFGDSAGSRYLTLQHASPLGGGEDWGVYVEVDDQRYSGYDRIASCVLSGSSMRVVLAKPLAGAGGPIDAIEAAFAVGARPPVHFVEHLRLIFTGREDTLRIGNDGPNG